MKKHRKADKKVIAVAVCSVLFTLAVVSLLFVYLLFYSGSEYVKFCEIRAILKNKFIGEFDEQEAEDEMYAGYVDAVGDKYTVYYPAEDAEKKADSMRGVFYGIGINTVKHPDTGNILITNVYSGSSAEKAGLKKGDQIIKVGDSPVKGKYSKSLDKLKGAENEKVKITCLRGESHEFQCEITYADCIIQTVYLSYVSDCAYIEITAFNDATVEQFKDAIDSIENAKGIIIDLRSNGGGTVDSVSQMLDYICPKGTLMYVKYANDSDKRVLKTSDKNKATDLPIAVLTDSDTASAAELFSANVRDFGLGVLIGKTTYGKGVMQMTYPLTDGSAVKVTVAEYFPNSGVSYDGEGLHPDIEVKLSNDEEKRLVLLSGTDDPYIAAAVRWLNEK